MPSEKTKDRAVAGTHRAKLRRLISMRRGTVAAVVAGVFLLFPAVAFAYWSQTYVSNTIFNPDGIGLSSLHTDIIYNDMQWENNGDVGQTTLCDPSYVCEGYDEDNDGNVLDYRMIGDGRAKCHSYSGNSSAMYVYDCTTDGSS